MKAIDVARKFYRKIRWSFFWNNFQLPPIDILELVDVDNKEAPAITEKLCIPPYEGPDDHDDIDPLLRLIKYYKPATVLELGTAHGATVANICMVSDAKVYTVNALPEQISGEGITFVLDKEEIGYVYRKYGFADRVMQIFENTLTMDLENYFPIRNIDFAIIDACHDIDFVINDFFKILPFLKDGGVVLFHDVSPSMKLHLADSYVACMYLRRLGFNIYHVRNTWWAILKRKDDQIHYSKAHKIVIAMENILLRTLGYDMRRDAVHMRWLASVFVTSKFRNTKH